MRDKISYHAAEKMLTVSAPPFIHHSDSIRIIMLDVIIALLPSIIWGVYLYGTRAAVITSISVVSCIAFEFLSCLILKRPLNSLTDLSAVVTGFFIAMNTPVAASLYIPILGAFIAVVLVKQLFGGIGKNLLNPALTAISIITLIRPNEMSSNTVLKVLMQQKLPDISLGNLFIGNLTESGKNTGYMLNGTIGEASAFLLILGGIYLLVRKVITYDIPISFLGTVALLVYLFPKYGVDYEFMFYFLLAGRLVLCAIFMTSDPVTSPVTRMGRIVYGILCGVLTVVLRYFSAFEDGVLFAVLVMNLLVRPIDSIFSSREFLKSFNKQSKNSEAESKSE